MTNTGGGRYKNQSAGLIPTVLTGQDSHPGRGQNEGYLMLNLISLNRT